MRWLAPLRLDSWAGSLKRDGVALRSFFFLLDFIFYSPYFLLVIVPFNTYGKYYRIMLAHTVHACNDAAGSAGLGPSKAGWCVGVARGA